MAAERAWIDKLSMVSRRLYPVIAGLDKASLESKPAVFRQYQKELLAISLLLDNLPKTPQDVDFDNSIDVHSALTIIKEVLPRLKEAVRLVNENSGEVILRWSKRVAQMNENLSNSCKTIQGVIEQQVREAAAAKQKPRSSVQGSSDWRENLSTAFNTMESGEAAEELTTQRKQRSAKPDWLFAAMQKAKGTTAEVTGRLLTHPEPMALIEMPVILNQTLITALGRVILSKHFGVDVDDVMYYQVIKNAKVFGVHRKLVEVGVQKFVEAGPHDRRTDWWQVNGQKFYAHFRQALQLQENEQKLFPVSPVKLTVHYAYALLLPHQLVGSEIKLGSWDFLTPEVAKAIRVSI